jgi:Calcineurin-like phosphoesterase
MPRTPSFRKPKRDFNNPVSPPAQHYAFIPAPPTNNVNLTLPLDIVLPGADAKIAAAKAMVFHAVGDTGGVNGTATQEGLAEVMVHQIEESRTKAQPGNEPLFFYHLGDVVYFNGMSSDYPVQFYEPYQNYDAPIFAIAGNHDGDTRTRTGDVPDNESTLYGFMQNFCAPVSQFLFKYRATMTQPYVYWTLATPLATIIGLYSNVDGDLDAPGTFEQQRWFAQQLKEAPTDRALIVAVHHAPYSLDSTHGGYADIGESLDRAFNTSGRTPDLILSGHVHNYQRFTRTLGDKQIPYVVAGAGGYADSARAMHRIAKDPSTGEKIAAPFQTSVPDVTLAAYNDTEPGFLRLKVTKSTITGEYYTIDFEDKPQGTRDTFTVTLAAIPDKPQGQEQQLKHAPRSGRPPVPRRPTR